MHRLILSRLKEKEGNIRTSWNSSNLCHTRYFAVDDLLPPDKTVEIFNAFPKHGEHFNKLSSFREKKKTFAKLNILPKILTDITFSLQETSVIRKLEELTEIEGLEGDPMLYAGGLSMMFKDNFLNPHIDNSHDSERARYRRLNLLFYQAPAISTPDTRPAKVLCGLPFPRTIQTQRKYTLQEAEKQAVTAVFF